MNKQRKNISKPAQKFLFGKRNYLFLFVGLFLIAIGFVLMSGGGSEDPNVFDPGIYNFRRIRLAPTLILFGLALQGYAILLNPDKNKK